MEKQQFTEDSYQRLTGLRLHIYHKTWAAGSN
jgi:hypothetical protein